MATFAKAAYDHLRVQGETLKEFSPQLKSLTDKDRTDLIVDFEKMGVHIDTPSK